MEKGTYQALPRRRGREIGKVERLMLNHARTHIGARIGLLTALTVAPSAGAAEPIPAFPGAEGPGATATGGRGGEVYHVTSLADDGSPGTLRHAVTTVPDAGRIVVFDVGGVIRLATPGRAGWLDSKQPNLTIAGQTAPPPGITVAGSTTKLINPNLVLRHVRFRPGPDAANPGMARNDALSLQTKHSILDHVSVSWADDEGLSATDAITHTTVQYCIVAEGLNYLTVNEGHHSMGSLIGSEVDDAPVAFHHNLYAHNRTRNPRLGNKRGTGAVVSWTNNVVYNWRGNAAYTVEKEWSRTNFAGNYYVLGPSNGADDPVFDSPNELTRLWQRDNVFDRNRDGRLDGGPHRLEGVYVDEPAPFDVAGGFLQPATDALERVLDHAGAAPWHRDPVDARIVTSVRTGTGRIIDTIDDVGGWPVLPETRRPDGFDADRDGMPDAWERDHGLDPGVADDAGDFDGDGYTNVEEYLNDLAAFPAPTPLEWKGGDGGYERAAHWPLRWQPSRFDAVVLASGRATVAHPGQHAGTLRVAGQSGADAPTLTVSGGWIRVARDLHVGPGVVELAGGEVRVGGAAVLGEAARVGVTLGADGRSGTMRVDGALTLGGALAILTLPGVEPRPGQRWLIATAGAGVQGEFAGVSPGFAVHREGDRLFVVVGDGR
jgi:pectate lyase